MPDLIANTRIVLENCRATSVVWLRLICGFTCTAENKNAQPDSG